MAKIRNLFFQMPKGKDQVECNVHYFPNSRFDSAMFLIVPKDKALLLPNCELIITHSAGAHTYKGVKGSTEKEAHDKFKQYLEYYVENVSKRIPLIFIKIDDSHSDGYHYRREKELKIDDVKINFEYKVGYSVEIGGKIKYFTDQVYYDDAESEINQAPNEDYRYTIIPYSEEAVKKCETIVAEFIKINTNLKTLFKDPTKAETALISNNNLLQYGAG